ncbi:CLUMA_CG009326, isoform A [Clunio marinus]|uniref:CLUMA_CG009326, isoform A n=1 Tax=Clunio marinus TaxID=568069 RepID=A0A1J1I6J1_9DIPT|nr:CLUMA_CG009326, isoform A [Clunio marinus]
MKVLLVLSVFCALTNAAPSAVLTPLLARVEGEAPASTVHAAHVVQQVVPQPQVISYSLPSAVVHAPIITAYNLPSHINRINFGKLFFCKYLFQKFSSEL